MKKKLLDLSEEQLNTLILTTANKLGISEAIIEKDLWVCMILKYLFSDFKYKDSLIFKGGTSLSKVYNIIERFSEDIDLILDWKILGYGIDEPYETRSNSKQIKFNSKLNEDTKVFITNELLPILKKDFKEILKDRKHNFYIDNYDGQVISFEYPKMYNDNSLLQEIRLEIGCLAESMPSSNRTIKTYIEETYPIFDEEITVMTIDSLRTFYEKLTILHREAHRINGNYPQRYSRHFYDVYKMLLTDIRNRSFNNIDLLKTVIEFKKKFYASNWANYDLIMEGQMKLIPKEEAIKIFSQDYDHMQNMLFGKRTSFDEIVKVIEEYESQINDSITSFILQSQENYIK